MELSLASIPATVREMRNAAAECAVEAGAPEAMVHDVRLAVSEAVTNSLRHGSSPGEQIAMRVTLASPGRLTISISDRGPAEGSEYTKGLGLGLPIMTAVATDLHVTRVASGRIVTMTFRWDP